MKTNIIKLSPLHFFQFQEIAEHNNSTITEVPDTKFLGVQIDLNLNFMLYRSDFCQKLSTACFVIRQLFYVLNLKTLWMAYFAYEIRNFILGQCN